MFLDGKELGTSDGEFPVGPGVGRVVVKLDGHQSETKEVTIEANRVTRIELALKPAKEANTENLLKNPSAETGDEAPDGWQQGDAIPGVTYSWDKTVASEGKASLCIKKTEKRYFPIAQWSQVIERKGDDPMLEVSAQVKAKNMTKAILDVVFLDKDGRWVKGLGHRWAAYIGGAGEFDPPANHDWKKYSGTIEIPPGTARLVIGLQVYGPGEVWFDDVKARYRPARKNDVGLAMPVPMIASGPAPGVSVDVKPDAQVEKSTVANENILANASIEAGDKTPDAWQKGAAIPGVTYSWNKKVASEGKASLSIKKTVNRYFPIAQWSQEVERKGDAPVLELSAKVRAKEMTKAVLDVVFLDKNGQWVEGNGHQWAAYIGSKEENDPPANHDWKEYSGTVNIPPGTAKFVIGLQVYGPGQVWFDDIKASYRSADAKK